MAVTSAQIIDFLLANPGMSDAQIVSAMDQYGVSPAQMAQAVGLPVTEVQQRYEAVVAPPAPVVAPAPAPVTNEQIVEFLNTNPNITGAELESVMTQYNVSPAQIASALTENVAQYGTQTQTLANNETGQTEVNLRNLGAGFNAYQDESGQLSFSRVDPSRPGMIQLFGPNGEYRGEERITTTTQDLISNLGPIALAAGGTALAQGLLSGGLGTNLGSTGLTASQLAATDLALGGAGGTAGATSLANALATGATVPTISSLTGGSGLLTSAPITAESVAAKLAADAATQAQLLNAGAGAFTPTTLTPVNTTPIITPPPVAPPVPPVPPVAPPVPPVPPVVTPPVVTPPVVTPPVVTPPVVTPPVVTPPVVTPPVEPGLLTPAVTSVLPAITNALTNTLTPTNIGNLLTSGATTAAGLLQQQTSREAAQKAQAMIDAETAAAKQAAQFRPVGMTTRFGTSQFQVDPVTGQLTSAGYTLSPEAKNAQDRLVKLAEQGLVQAEGAQQQFAPLQTGAQNLFNLGNQYLAKSPQDVAQNYLNQQMALLQPGREMELANLQNRLQQQGRGGLSVAQGGTMGATTPELQALYNARAQQEAQLAANAQQYGQQQVSFGAGLLGQGSQAMGQYYGGQQAAYAPYTTALGQVQGLETAAQQPLTMGAALGQQAAQAGFNVGQLGLRGAGQSVALATGPAATTNPYSTALSGLGASPAFGQALGGLLGGGLQSAFGQTGLGASGFGTGLAYGNQDLGLFL